MNFAVWKSISSYSDVYETMYLNVFTCYSRIIYAQQTFRTNFKAL